MTLLSDAVVSTGTSPDGRPHRPVRLGAHAAVAGVLGGLYATYGVLVNPLRPHVSSALGFYGWIDQSFYLRTVRVLASGHLPTAPRDYMYGLGYPALGALASKLGFHSDPFGAVDVVLFGVICGLTWILAVRLWRTVLGRERPAAGYAAVALLALGTPLFQLVITPWNSTLAAALMLGVLVLVSSPRHITWPRAVAVGCCIGWTFATRYGDALFITIPVVAALFVRTRPERRRVLAGAGLAIAVIVVFVGYTQHHAFGDAFTTPYHFHRRLGPGLGNDQSLSNYRLRWVPRHFVTTVITGPAHGSITGGEPMLRQFPMLVFAPLGAIALVRRTGRARVVWISTIVAAALSSVFYLSFIAGGGDDLKFWNLRYWAIWYPLWTGFALIGAKRSYDWLVASTARWAERRQRAAPRATSDSDHRS